MDEQTLTLRPPVWLPIAVAAIAGFFYVGGKMVETRDRGYPTITVSGEGRVFAAPNIALLSLGVQTGRQRTAKEAMTKLAQTMDAVFVAVKKTGVKENDIRTEYLNLHPVYDWTEREGQILRGFEASQSLRVKVRDLDNATTVLEAATAAGANQAGGVTFVVDDPEAKRAEARAAAIAEAQEKASALAQSLGEYLGELEGFQEGNGFSFPPPIPMMARAIGEDASMEKAPPIPPGEQEITVQVTLTYALE